VIRLPHSDALERWLAVHEGERIPAWARVIALLSQIFQGPQRHPILKSDMQSLHAFHCGVKSASRDGCGMLLQLVKSPSEMSMDGRRPSDMT
jgi:hypothetical protein